MLTLLSAFSVITEMIVSSIENGPLEVLPLKDMYEMIQKSKENKSITKKYLTSQILQKYENIETPSGSTLALCVRTNSKNPDAILPRCAHTECYDVFNEFFNPIIKDYHKIHTDRVNHPPPNYGQIENLKWKDLDPTRKYIISTRIRVGRTVQGFAFAPLITKKERLELEERIKDALSKLSGDLVGSYYSLSRMNRYMYDSLVEDHYLFRDDDSVLRDAGGYRDWPSGRGIFMNSKQTFLVWVNEEDHMRIISMQKGNNMEDVYRRLISGISKLDEQLGFARHSHYGFLAFCPSNLGTSLRASVHIKLPLVSSLPNFKEICEKFNMEVRGTHGERTETVGGIHDIGNKRRLGFTEIDAMTEMRNGIEKLINLEMQMEKFNKGIPVNLMPVEPLDVMYDLIHNSDSKSLTKKYLTKEVVDKFKDIRTTRGSSLSHCIRNCAYNPRALCPRNGDAECYTTFHLFMDKIIVDYHGLLNPNVKHPVPTFGNTDNLPFGNVDPSGKFVISTRVRVGRSVEGFNFTPTIDKDQRLRLEKMISSSLESLQGELAGKYYPLLGMDENVRKQLVDDHFLFKNDDPVLRDAGGYRDWPSGRGIFHNRKKTFLVWVNEEDHIRIISMQNGGNLAEIYQRLIHGIQQIEQKIKFSHNDKFGYLTCCPTNLGTTMRASVHLKIPKLSAHKAKFDTVCNKHNLQARGFYGEHTESADGIYDISNKRRLGLTEIEAAQEMAAGVEALIQMERSM